METHDGVQPDYKIVLATLGDRDRIFTFMQTHFYKFEPLSVCLGLTEGPGTDQIYALTSLHEGNSLIAVTTSANGDENIVGICLNGEVLKNDGEGTIVDLLKVCPCSQYAKMLKFFADCDGAEYVWKDTGVDKVLDIHVITVDTEKRRGGLGKMMIEHSYKLAKELGYPALSMHCTSHYSASLAQKLGMRLVFEKKYDEYLDTNGCPVFQPPPPHVAFRSYVQIVK